MEELCPICGGNGLRIIERPDGSRAAQDCVCRVERRVARMTKSAKIPKRYEHCSLDSFDTTFPSASRSLTRALTQARKFVSAYPLETRGTGLLLTGTVGVGKTHLAVGLLQSLIADRNVTGLFYDYRELLKQVQNSYNRQVQVTELEVLAPVFEADVLVLDELGAAKPSEWVWDTVAHIINSRYNDRRTTIITTNYPNEIETPKEYLRGLTEPERAMHRETLGDRIGERMRSRLQEMCVVVEMQGVDFRQTVNLARFG